MAIHFSKDRMEEVKDNYRRWWNGELDRPIVNLTLHGAHPHPSKSRAPWLSQSSCGDFRWSPEELIDTMDEETFKKWLEYHFAICERQDLIGASHHTLDVLKIENGRTAE